MSPPSTTMSRVTYAKAPMGRVVPQSLPATLPARLRQPTSAPVTAAAATSEATWFYHWVSKKDGSSHFYPYPRDISEALETALQSRKRACAFRAADLPHQPPGALVEVNFDLMMELGPKTATGVTRKVAAKPILGLPRRASIRKDTSTSPLSRKPSRRVSLGDEEGQVRKEVFVFEVERLTDFFKLPLPRKARRSTAEASAAIVSRSV